MDTNNIEPTISWTVAEKAAVLTELAQLRAELTEVKEELQVILKFMEGST